MQESCSDIFTCACFTANQHCWRYYIAGNQLRNALDLYFNALHSRAVAQQFDTFGGMHITLPRIIQTIILNLSNFGFLNGEQQLFKVYWLFKIIYRALLYGVHSITDFTMCRHHNDR